MKTNDYSGKRNIIQPQEPAFHEKEGVIQQK
jgi:hypothetical protein